MLGTTAAYNNRMIEAKKGLRQMNVKGDTNDCFLFENWFASEWLAESEMDVGAEIIGMVKTNTKGLCKNTITNMTKYWPGGSYLVLKINSMVYGYIPLIAID